MQWSEQCTCRALNGKLTGGVPHLFVGDRYAILELRLHDIHILGRGWKVLGRDCTQKTESKRYELRQSAHGSRCPRMQCREPRSHMRENWEGQHLVALAKSPLSPTRLDLGFEIATSDVTLLEQVGALGFVGLFLQRS